MTDTPFVGRLMRVFFNGCMLSLSFEIVMQQQPIKLKNALALMHQKDDTGQQVTFQVSFYTTTTNKKNFKRINLPIATLCGLPRQHKSSKYLVGMRPLLRQNHDYSVHQKLIVEFNNQPVIP